MTTRAAFAAAVLLVAGCARLWAIRPAAGADRRAGDQRADHRRHRLAGPRRRRGDCRRPYRRGARRRRGDRRGRPRRPGHRRRGPGGGARVHRHALALGHAAGDRRQRAEQDPPGRDHRGDRRVGLDRAAGRGHRRPAVDRLRRLLRGAREARHLGEPALVRRPRHGARAGHRRRQSQTHRRRAARRCRASSPRRCSRAPRASPPGSSIRPTPTPTSTSWWRCRPRPRRWAAATPRTCATTASGCATASRRRSPSASGRRFRSTSSTSRSPASRTSAA